MQDWQILKTSPTAKETIIYYEKSNYDFFTVKTKRSRQFITLSYLLALVACLYPLLLFAEYKEVKYICIDNEIGIKGGWHANAYQAEEAGVDPSFTDNAAKICFALNAGDINTCFDAKDNNNNIYECYLKIYTIDINCAGKPQRAVIFLAQHLGAREPVELLNVFTYNHKNNAFVKLTDNITIFMRGSFEFYGNNYSLNEVLIVANRGWMNELAPHKYKIDIYRIRSLDKGYELISSYITNREYDFEVDDIIKQEMKVIKRLITSSRRR
jgi:hypothetical protein